MDELDEPTGWFVQHLRASAMSTATRMLSNDEHVHGLFRANARLAAGDLHPLHVDRATDVVQHVMMLCAHAC